MGDNRDVPSDEQIFDVPVAQVEAIVEPDCVADDIWWESVAFRCVHLRILSISGG